jgi:hypothetical protein
MANSNIHYVIQGPIDFQVCLINSDGKKETYFVMKLSDSKYRTMYCGKRHYYRTYHYYMDRQGEIYKAPKTPNGDTGTDHLGEPLPEDARRCKRRKTESMVMYEVI